MMGGGCAMQVCAQNACGAHVVAAVQANRDPEGVGL